jgi:hypothetical protein
MQALFAICCIVGLFLDPEDGSNILLRNVGLLSTDYVALSPRRWNSMENSEFVFIITVG